MLPDRNDTTFLQSASFAALAAGCIFLILPGLAEAKSRWYQVEVIVFRYVDPSTAEQPAAPRIQPDYSGAISLVTDLPAFDDEPDAPGANEVSRPGPIAFKSLSRTELKTSGVYRRLRDLAAYEPVLHVGWRQPGSGSRRSREIYITDKPRLPTDMAVGSTAIERPVERRVEGTVRVRTGRLLHVETDFLSYGESVPVRINERRKIKFKELHYFDNPFFGVIVQVTPYRIATPEPEPAEAAVTN